MIRDKVIRCEQCGTVIMTIDNGHIDNRTIEGRCDFGNCDTHACPECGDVIGATSFGPAGYPDCPCDGTPVRTLRWPWTSERFVNAYTGFHMWGFAVRCSDAWWRHLLTPIPYLLFGNCAGAMYRHARLHNPDYFERKTQS